MADKKFAAILKEEHHCVQTVVATMVVMADMLDTGKEVRPDALRDAVEFMRLAQRGHEAKEELYLFPAFLQKGVSIHSVPSRGLIEDHLRGKGMVTRLEESAVAFKEGRLEAKTALVESLRALASLYPLHIWQEDLLLFHKADGLLTRDDDDELVSQFKALDEALGGNILGRFQSLADKIEREMW
jgi:hemerythrin-like domain-containing protein